MQIPKELIEKWKALKSSEDANKMTQLIGQGGYPEMFHRAFRIGRCSDDVFKVMSDFYKEKANLIKEYL